MEDRSLHLVIWEVPEVSAREEGVCWKKLLGAERTALSVLLGILLTAGGAAPDGSNGRSMPSEKRASEFVSNGCSIGISAYSGDRVLCVCGFLFLFSLHSSNFLHSSNKIVFARTSTTT
jgi:hypothetical protein